MSTTALTPNLFFRLISFYCVFDGSSKLTGETNQFVKGFRHFVGLFLISNGSLLLGSYVTTREWQFSPHSYGKKWESLCRLLRNRFLVKISQNLPPHFWHSTLPGPRTSVKGLFGLVLWKYYVWAISVPNFSPLNAFLLSILITFPVCLIMRGVLSSSFISFPRDVLRHRQTDILNDGVIMKASFDKLSNLKHFSGM